jgi:hypothetical protein
MPSEEFNSDPRPSEFISSPGLKMRLTAAAWFSVFGYVPVGFFLEVFQGPMFNSGSQTWTYGALPISAAALSGFIFGARILDPWNIETAARAILQGIKIAFLSYILFLGMLVLFVAFSAESPSIVHRISGSIVAFFVLGFYGSIFVGWLIFLMGLMGGFLLFSVSRLPLFESWLFEAPKASKTGRRLMVAISVFIFFVFSFLIFSLGQRSEAETRVKTEARIEAKKGQERQAYNLAQAAREGDVPALQSHLLNGADPNYVGSMGDCLITSAASGGSTVAVKLLLDHGANPNGMSRDTQSPLFWAALGANQDMIKILLDAGADINFAKGGRTPLMGAVNSGDIETVRLLLARGSDVNARMGDGSGRTSLATAQTMESPTWLRDREAQGFDWRGPIIKLLKQHGAVE